MARIVFILEDGTEIETELDSPVITLGRHPDSQVVLPSVSVSSHHATIKKRGDDFYVQDLGTTNGTKLNGVEVEEGKLSHGDRVTLGDISGTVYLTSAPVHKGAPAKPAEPSAKSDDAGKTGRPPLPSGKPASPISQQRQFTQYKDGTGCASFFMLVVFLTVAFIAGMCLRHYNNTNGGFLPVDLFKKLQSVSPPAKDQKAAEKK